MNRNTSTGFGRFINKANFDMNMAIDRYEKIRKYTKDPEKLLQETNLAVYNAIKERELFQELENKFEDNGENF